MDMNTTAVDGTPCALCGERADQSITIQTYEGDFRLVTLPACHECVHDDTTECPGCHERILQLEGIRIYRSPNLYCRACAAKEPALIEGRYRAMLDDTLKGN